MRYQLVTREDRAAPKTWRQFKSRERAERAWERATETNDYAVLMDNEGYGGPVIIADHKAD